MESQPTFKIVQSLDDLIKALIVRGIVFIGEQHVGYRDEVDEHEYSAVHILGELDGEPIAAARVRFDGPSAWLQRFAVRKEHRGRGYGAELLRFAMQVARRCGFSTFHIHAQVTAKRFYSKHGFEVRGDTFLKAGIEHCLMVRAE